jgi:hypothetical protein
MNRTVPSSMATIDALNVIHATPIHDMPTVSSQSRRVWPLTGGLPAGGLGGAGFAGTALTTGLGAVAVAVLEVAALTIAAAGWFPSPGFLLGSDMVR